MRKSVEETAGGCVSLDSSSDGYRSDWSSDCVRRLVDLPPPATSYFVARASNIGGNTWHLLHTTSSATRRRHAVGGRGSSHAVGGRRQ